MYMVMTCSTVCSSVRFAANPLATAITSNAAITVINRFALLLIRINARIFHL